MRSLSALTVLVAVLSISFGNGEPEQPRAQVVSAPPSPMTCNGARKGIKFYRAKTWEYQDELRERRHATRYPERVPGRCPYLARWVAGLWKGRAVSKSTRVTGLREDPRKAICYVFGPYCEQALQVAGCESRLSVTATNGQYLGLFQMGSYARGRYGHSPNALGQSFAAYDYFVASGRDWSPWSCKPW